MQPSVLAPPHTSRAGDIYRASSVRILHERSPYRDMKTRLWHGDALSSLVYVISHEDLYELLKSIVIHDLQST
jgi:hypothetical protein